MTIHSPLLRSALGLAVLGFAGCDVTDPLKDVELHLDLNEAPVEIPASFGTVAVAAGQATVTNGTVSNDTDVDRIERLKAITLLPSYFTFTPAAVGSTTGDLVPLAQSGTLSLFVFLNGVPVPGTPVQITIQNDAVTAVSPQRIEIAGATVDVSTVQAFLAALNGVPVPLAAGWETMTVDQIVARINDALASYSIPISIGVTATGDLDGTLRLSRISFDAEAVLTQ